MAPRRHRHPQRPAEPARAPAGRRPPRAGGFTLVEMLIVMAVIVLAVTLAVPAIRAMTGEKSEQAAQNTVSAFLARARAEAVGLQRVEGVVFYLDPATDRVTLAQVWETSLVGADPSGVEYLDLVPDHDTLTLPPGIRLQTLNANPGDANSLYPNDRYIGFNPITDQNKKAGVVAVGGVLLFDGEGRVTNLYYNFRCESIDSSNKSVQTAMGALLGLGSSGGGYATKDNSVSQGLRSTVGFVTFNRDEFVNNGGTDADAQSNESTEETWLDNNTTPVLVNRYNGTLIRAE